MHQNLPIAFAYNLQFLVRIHHLRTYPQAESVEKQLLAKRMTCTLSLDVSPFKNMTVSAIGTGGKIAVAWVKSNAPVYVLKRSV